MTNITYQKGSVKTGIIALVILVVFVIVAGTVYAKKSPSLLNIINQNSTTTPVGSASHSNGSVTNTYGDEVGASQGATHTTSMISPFVGGVVYHNAQYGLTVPLPASWSDYTVVESKEAFAGVLSLASLHFYVRGQNPLTINVFTKEQWNDIRIQETNNQVNGFGEGNYLGENTTYIFATNSIGGEETSLIQSNIHFY
jgi:hypothetical protein